MKAGKASEEDGFPVEIVQTEREVPAEWCLVVGNEAFKTEWVPAELQEGLIYPIFKKEDKTAYKNHRWVALLSHTGKFYTGIAQQRLRKYVKHKLGEWQHVFRSGRGTIDFIFYKEDAIGEVLGVDQELYDIIFRSNEDFQSSR